VENEIAKELLIVDDDRKISSLMQKFLAAYGYHVAIAACGKEMFVQLATKTFDLIILDVMLPGDDGFELCRRVRTQNMIPIIMLTAMGTDTERILGLELGADDYLTKPFNPNELLARIRAILRRSVGMENTVSSLDNGRSVTRLLFKGWILDKLVHRLISPDGVEVTLTSGEYRLLEVLAEHPKQILSRDALLETTNNRHGGSFDRSIDVRISRLRQKIESDPKQPMVIKTVRGGGYIFATDVERMY
jgi:two-component system, OmpR family, response regulator